MNIKALLFGKKKPLPVNNACSVMCPYIERHVYKYVKPPRGWVGHSTTVDYYCSIFEEALDYKYPGYTGLSHILTRFDYHVEEYGTCTYRDLFNWRYR